MGSGKTTVGRRLAKCTGRHFRDSDRELEKKANVMIEDIFRYEGEEGFRKREAAILEDLTAERDIVLATGGGAVLLPENRRVLGARGIVVYLHASPAEQWRRLQRDRSRPLLQTEDPRGTLETLFAERDPLYRDLSDVCIDVDGVGSAHACAGIVKTLDLREVHPDE